MLRASDEGGASAAHEAVGRAKRAFGERSSLWWHDDSPHLSRYMARIAPYAEWSASLGRQKSDAVRITRRK